jgi:Helix-turn-helix domain
MERNELIPQGLQRSMIPTEPYYRIKEAAEALAVSKETARKLFRQGPGVMNIASNPKGRRSLRISASALEAMRRKLQAAP